MKNLEFVNIYATFANVKIEKTINHKPNTGTGKDDIRDMFAFLDNNHDIQGLSHPYMRVGHYVTCRIEKQ